MISTIEERLVKTFGYFVEDRYPGTIIQEQKGVMRTNCLDCLDRTNVVQTKIAFRIVENILDRLKESNRKTTQASRVHVDQYQLQMLGFTEATNDGYIFEVLKHMWADNGDAISK